MALTTLFLAEDTGSPAYTAEQIRLLIDNLFTAGVLSGFVVSERGAGANTSVDVTGGIAVVEGPSSIADESRYMVQADAGDNVAVGSAPGSNYRNDIIGIYVNDPDAPGSGDTTRVAEFDVITGSGHTPATSAGAAIGATGDPSIPDRFLPLARVRWSAGMVSITNADIDDLRQLATLRWDVVDDAQATRLGTATDSLGTLVRRSASTGQIGLSTPTLSTHAATKGYVDALGTSSTTGDTIMRRDVDGRARVVSPSSASDIANKSYVDAKTWGTAAIDDGAITQPKVALTWTTLTNGSTDCRYTKLGDMVVVAVRKASGSNVTLPAGYRPPWSAVTYDGTSLVTINTAGVISGGSGVAVTFTYPAA